MPPFLPFGETIEIASWESHQIELDLARGLQGAKEASKQPSAASSPKAANASTPNTAKGKGKGEATGVPEYKSENVRKLPYCETGTRFTLPEPFPQLDALDEKLNIFNPSRALHKIYTYTAEDEKRGRVPKKHLPRLTCISPITTASIDRKGKGKATAADPDADVITIPDDDDDGYFSPIDSCSTPEPPPHFTPSAPPRPGPSRQFGTIDSQAYRRIRAEHPGARRPERPVSVSLPRRAPCLSRRVCAAA